MTVEQAEQAFNEWSSDTIGSHRWGQYEEAELARRAEALQKAYDEAGTPEADRIVL